MKLWCQLKNTLSLTHRSAHFYLICLLVQMCVLHGLNARQHKARRTYTTTFIYMQRQYTFIRVFLLFSCWIYGINSDFTGAICFRVRSVGCVAATAPACYCCLRCCGYDFRSSPHAWLHLIIVSGQSVVHRLANSVERTTFKRKFWFRTAANLIHIHIRNRERAHLSIEQTETDNVNLKFQ